MLTGESVAAIAQLGQNLSAFCVCAWRGSYDKFSLLTHELAEILEQLKKWRWQYGTTLSVVGFPELYSLTRPCAKFSDIFERDFPRGWRLCSRYWPC